MKQQKNQTLKEINVYDTKLDNQTPTHTTTYINIILKKKNKSPQISSEPRITNRKLTTMRFG